MQKPAGIEWGFYFNPVHIISVNYAKQEARLFENGGFGDGKLLFKKDEPAAKVSLSDPFQVMNMAIHFVVGYDLIAQIADEEMLRFFERVGIKEFLERLAAATTDEERHHRFTGLGPKFTPFPKDTRSPTQPPTTPETKEEEPASPPASEPEAPEPKAAQTTRQGNRARA